MIKVQKKISINTALSLTVSSPDSLVQQMRKIQEDSKLKTRYISLVLNDVQVLTRLFNFRKTTLKELEQDLIHDASDLLSLPVGDIEFDFQVLFSNAERMEGIYVCAPKVLVRKYLSEIDKISLIPSNITAYITEYINFFLKEHKKMPGVTCLVDISQENLIYFSVLDGKQCKFLRKVGYENDEEMRNVVIQTFQGACALSPSKRFDQICIIGDIELIQELTPYIKQKIEAPIEHLAAGVKMEISHRAGFLQINLIKKYVFSLKTRKRIVFITYLIIFLLFMQSVFLGMKIRYKDIYLQIQRLSYSEFNYQYAQELAEKLK